MRIVLRKGIVTQAAYVRQYLEQVKQTQAQLAAQAGGTPADSKHPAEAKSGSEGEKRLKTEHNWVAAAANPDVQPKVFSLPDRRLHCRTRIDL